MRKSSRCLVCYTVPLAGAAISSLVWHQKKDIKIGWLSLMLWGGAIFGVIDHLWNGELFLISGNLFKDLLLGAVIAVTILIFWSVLSRLVELNKNKRKILSPQILKTD